MQPSDLLAIIVIVGRATLVLATAGALGPSPRTVHRAPIVLLIGSLNDRQRMPSPYARDRSAVHSGLSAVDTPRQPIQTFHVLQRREYDGVSCL